MSKNCSKLLDAYITKQVDPSSLAVGPIYKSINCVSKSKYFILFGSNFYMTYCPLCLPGLTWENLLRSELSEISNSVNHTQLKSVCTSLILSNKVIDGRHVEI